jgi:hypothetical protein
MTLFSEIYLGMLYVLVGYLFNYNVYWLFLFDAIVMALGAYFAIQTMWLENHDQSEMKESIEESILKFDFTNIF